MSSFQLSVCSFEPPAIPETPPDLDPSEIRSPRIRHILLPTAPLRFSLSLPSARDDNPIFPATHLQLSYRYEETGELFVSHVTPPEALVKRESETLDNVYEIELPPAEIYRAKVNQGTTSKAELLVYAWKKEKLLGKWLVGEIDGLGIEGLKSTDIALRRQAKWAADREKKSDA